MKKLILILLCAALVLSLSACAVCGPVLLALPASQDDAYEAGYAAGYEAGYAAALADYNIEPFTYDGSGLVWEMTPYSDCFSAIAYDPAEEMLAVIFNKTPGKTYVYSHFTAQDYAAFTENRSLGTYYNENIKGQFNSHKIVNPEGTNFMP